MNGGAHPSFCLRRATLEEHGNREAVRCVLAVAHAGDCHYVLPTSLRTARTLRALRMLATLARWGEAILLEGLEDAQPVPPHGSARPS